MLPDLEKRPRNSTKLFGCVETLLPLRSGCNESRAVRFLLRNYTWEKRLNGELWQTATISRRSSKRSKSCMPLDSVCIRSWLLDPALNCVYSPVKLASGDRKRARERLRATFKEKSHHRSTFASGVMLGLAVPAFVFGLYAGLDSNQHLVVGSSWYPTQLYIHRRISTFPNGIFYWWYMPCLPCRVFSHR